jgi:hypothetical protein
MGDAGAGRDPSARRARQLVRFTSKASEELGEAVLDEKDALQILAGLSGADVVGRIESERARNGFTSSSPKLADRCST